MPPMRRPRAWELPGPPQQAAGGQESQETQGTETESQQPASIEGQRKKRSWEIAGLDRGEAAQTAEAQREQAGTALADLLLQLHREGLMTAKHTCLISHYAHKAGACGRVAEYAFRPGAPSGHYQRHLDLTAGLRDKAQKEKFYKVSAPCFSRRLRLKGTRQLDVLPPHECLQREFEENPALKEQLEAAEWPTSFGDHPVAQASGGPVLPVALFVDGAQYTKIGASVIVFALVNLCSGVRHMICALDKRWLCKCGCRGWCTLRPIMVFLRWSFGALAAGSFPALDHSGNPWTDGDERRKSLAQSPLAFGTAAVQQVRGDWAEFAHTFGFPTWHSSDHPCIWCRADRETLYEWEAEIELLDHGSYDKACARCEVRVRFETRESLLEVAGQLFYDKRTYGNRGRCLKAPVPHIGLLKGDRVEPSPQLPDTKLLEEQEVPCTVLFWRRSRETAARHRNPIFDPEIGLTIKSLKVDSLHCLALGVWQVVLSAILAAIVAHDVYGAAAMGATTVESREHHTFQQITVELAEWVKKRKGLTPVQTEVSLPFRLKGAETKTLLIFMLTKFEAGWHQALDKGSAMLAALKALVNNYECISKHGLVWAKGAQAEHGTQKHPHDLYLGCGRQAASSASANRFQCW